MLSALSMVAYYRRYRIRITRSHMLSKESIALLKLKLQMNGFFPSLHPYDKKEPITLLVLIGLRMETYRGIYVSKAVSVRVLSFYLYG